MSDNRAFFGLILYCFGLSLCLTLIRFGALLDFDVIARAECNPGPESCFYGDSGSSIPLYKLQHMPGYLTPDCDPWSATCPPLNCSTMMDCVEEQCEGDGCVRPQN
jgi:hypothetical protein